MKEFIVFIHKSLFYVLFVSYLILPANIEIAKGLDLSKESFSNFNIITTILWVCIFIPIYDRIEEFTRSE